MRRLFVVIIASTALSGCGSLGSFSSFNPFTSSPPPPVTIQLESLPPGADAVTSLGPGCKTPCSVSIPPTPNFTVTFSSPRYQPVTVPVAVIINPGDFSTPASTTVDPNPIIAELPPAVPPRRVAKRAPARRPAAPAAAAPASGSPFPAPAR